MSFLEIAKKRYSVRGYQDKKVEEEKLQRILEAGRIAPTGANRQPQRIIVVREKEGFEKLKKAANVYNAPLALIVCGNHDEVWRRSYDGKSILDIDAAIVTDHMMLQATEEGLGTVWICYFNPEVIKKEFNLPKNIEPINILAVGYAAGAAASLDRHGKERKPLDSTVFYEHYTVK
ncbi:MAG: nitroreductase family protein [Caulobacteraceae bacterium]